VDFCPYVDYKLAQCHPYSEQNRAQQGFGNYYENRQASSVFPVQVVDWASKGEARRPDLRREYSAALGSRTEEKW
jgi:hypothetical protein